MSRRLAAWLVVLVPHTALAASREIELGVENFFYATVETALNRANVLGLDRSEDLLRGSFNWKESRGDARLVFRAFAEHRFDARRRDAATFSVRQAYAQYSWGPGVGLKVGKQRIAWGSGFAWNPTNRVEPAKNPYNTGLEQEGVPALRMDWAPTSWAGLILVGARGETQPGDLPFEAPAERRATAALRARFLVRNTDLALVYSGGKNQRTLVGFDAARNLGGAVSLHAEAAVYRGAEVAPPRDRQRFFRLATGALWARGETSVAVEYFFNGEGYTDGAIEAYLAGLGELAARAFDPRTPQPVRTLALGGYLEMAGVPFAGGLGLRRHYLHGSWTRTGLGGGKWTAAGRAVAGLADGGIALTPGLTYAPLDNLTVQLDGVVLLGPEQSEYRLAPLRRAIQVRLKLAF